MIDEQIKSHVETNVKSKLTLFTFFKRVPGVIVHNTVLII